MDRKKHGTLQVVISGENARMEGISEAIFTTIYLPTTARQLARSLAGRLVIEHEGKRLSMNLSMPFRDLGKYGAKVPVRDVKMFYVLLQQYAEVLRGDALLWASKTHGITKEEWSKLPPKEKREYVLMKFV